MFGRAAKKKLTAIDGVMSSYQGGVYKRIDESRELMALLNDAAPLFVSKYPKIRAWLLSNDKFLCALVKSAPPSTPQFQRKPGFPRRWPSEIELFSPLCKAHIEVIFNPKGGAKEKYTSFKTISEPAA